VDAKWRMLQQDEPGDYVVATGQTHTIRELLDVAFGAVGIDDWRPHVGTDRRFFRPAEVDVLIGDSSKARDKLGWEPTLDFHTLVKTMVDHDLELEARKAGDR
jgi:GDPmannose 4,6-dehydratase